MRSKDLDDEKAVWDPLWEFILDDHDSVEEDQTWRKSRPRSRRQQEKERQPGFFDVFFDNESEYSEVDDVSFRSGWQDSRDESNIKRSNEKSKSMKSSLKRRSQLTENAGVDNSMWDFFGMGNNNEGENKNNQKVQSRQVIQTEAEPKGNKKGGIFRRFRRKEYEGESAVSSAPKKRQVRVTVTEPSMPKAGTTNKTKTKRSKTKTSPRKADAIDPFQLFLEMAGKLDPFASDSDSEASISVPNNHTRDEVETDTDLGTDLYTVTAESVAEMDRLIEEAREDNLVNEIRLNFKPIHYKSGKEGYEENFNNSQAFKGERSIVALEDDEDLPEELEENSVASPAPRARINGVGSRLDTIDEEDRGESSLQREMSAFQSVLGANSRALQDRKRTAGIDESFLGMANGGNRRFGLKRLVCCSIKNHQDEPDLKEDSSEIPRSTLPTTRMVSDKAGDLPKVTSDGSNSGIMGVSSDHFAQTKGPQSLYAYEYHSEEHLDVFYSAIGAKPRSSMVVRKLGGPPTLLPSPTRSEVIIQVEASTVSETDCIIRQGFWWGSDMAPLANTPGVDVVGKIFQVKPPVGIQYGLQESQTVLSLTKWGGNSRYAAIDPAKLVKVPVGIDPAEAACLPEMYLSAFQVLHFGQTGQSRYERSSLRGKSILIVGSMANNMGKAIIELALNAGVANIYATAKPKHWKTLISFGIMPLSPDPLEWISRVEGTIDLVLASNGGLREDVTPTHFRALRPKTGRLIMCGRRVVGNDIPAGDWEQSPTTLVCSKQKEYTKMMHRSHSYDVFEQWDKCLEMCKRDLDHLLELLQRGVLKPTILDRIPLSKVPRAHELLESKRLSGFLICEPWMKGKKRAVYL